MSGFISSDKEVQGRVLKIITMIILESFFFLSIISRFDIGLHKDAEEELDEVNKSKLMGIRGFVILEKKVILFTTSFNYHDQCCITITNIIIIILITIINVAPLSPAPILFPVRITS